MRFNTKNTNMKFNFRSYHVRGINAETQAEKNAINQELKDLYASLNEEDKAIFNKELQVFLEKEAAALESALDGAKGQSEN